MTTVDELMEKADYAYSREDDLEKTLKYVYEAVKIDPADIRPLNLMGVTLFELGENDEALNCYEKILQIDPSNDEAKLKKGQMLTELEKYDEAILLFDELVENRSSMKDEAIIAKLSLTLEQNNEEEYQKTLKICNEIIEKEDSKYLKDEIGFILSIHEALKNIKKD